MIQPVFNGAGAIKEIVNGLDKKLKSKGMTKLEEAVGLKESIKC